MREKQGKKIEKLVEYLNAVDAIRIKKESLVRQCDELLAVATEYVDDQTELQMEKRNLEMYQESAGQLEDQLIQLQNDQDVQRQEMENSKNIFSNQLEKALNESNEDLERLSNEHKAAIDGLLSNFTGVLNKSEETWQLTYDKSIGKKYEIVASVVSTRMSAIIEVYLQMQTICGLMFSTALSVNAKCGRGLLFIPDTPLSTAFSVFRQSTIYKPPERSTYTMYKQGNPLEILSCASDSPQASTFIRSFSMNKKADFNLAAMDRDGLLRDFWNVRIWQAWMQFERRDGSPIEVKGRINLLFPQEFSNIDEKGETHFFQRPQEAKCGLKYRVRNGKLLRSGGIPTAFA